MCSHSLLSCACGAAGRHGIAHYGSPADVYSFSMVMYEILTGMLPFEDVPMRNIFALSDMVMSGQRPVVPVGTVAPWNYGAYARVVVLTCPYACTMHCNCAGSVHRKVWWDGKRTLLQVYLGYLVVTVLCVLLVKVLTQIPRGSHTQVLQWPWTSGFILETKCTFILHMHNLKVHRLTFDERWMCKINFPKGYKKHCVCQGKLCILSLVVTRSYGKPRVGSIAIKLSGKFPSLTLFICFRLVPLV